MLVDCVRRIAYGPSQRRLSNLGSIVRAVFRLHEKQAECVSDSVDGLPLLSAVQRRGHAGFDVMPLISVPAIRHSQRRGVCKNAELLINLMQKLPWNREE